jgi:hypothetical protein
VFPPPPPAIGIQTVAAGTSVEMAAVVVEVPGPFRIHCTAHPVGSFSFRLGVPPSLPPVSFTIGGV